MLLIAPIVAQLILLATRMIRNAKPIVLIGPMGSGKTSAGHRLSCVLKRDFYDTDTELVERTGVSISHIFDVEKEDGFRQRESKILAELCQLENTVIATGGGIVIESYNRDLLKKYGMVIYLQSSIECLLERTNKSKHRPLLASSNDKKQTIIDIVQKREKWYQECADITIDTSYKKLYMIINEIKKSINELP